MREKESQKCETLVVVNSGKSMTSDSQGIMAKGRGNMEDNIEVMAEEKKSGRKTLAWLKPQATSCGP